MCSKKGFMRMAAILGALLLVLSITSSATVCSAGVNPEVSNALNYLRSRQTSNGDIGGFSISAWVLMGIVAVGEEPHSWRMGDTKPSIVDYLRSNANQLGGKATDYERFVLAITAAKENPSNFGGVNYLSKLKSCYRDSQIGEIELLNDDFWGIIALVSAGESKSSPIIQASKNHIISNQNSDGGWSFGVGQSSDVDDTAAAIMALVAAGDNPNSEVMIGAINYLKESQAESGGFPWSPTSGIANSISTSWAIDAIVAVGQDPTSIELTKNGINPVDFLLSLQDVDGAFKWTADLRSNSEYATACSLQALAGKPYPVVIDPQVGVRVEGQDLTVWRGTVTLSGTFTTTAHNSGKSYTINANCPLGALDTASYLGGFSYTVNDQWYPGWDLFVDSVAGEANVGFSGWMCRVNYVSPNYGTAYGWLLSGPGLANGDEILWCYCNFGDLPLRISVDKTSVSVGEAFTVTVTTTDQDYSHDAGSPWPAVSWTPVSGATVHAGQNYVTGADGKITISINTAGSYNIFAEKNNHIRSDKVIVQVGGASGGGGYSEEQLQALVDAKTLLASKGKVEDVYNLLVEKGILAAEIPAIPANSFIYDFLLQQYGEQLEYFPSFEGRIQLLKALGIETIGMPLLKQENPPSPSLSPDEARAEAKTILESQGVEQSYYFLVENGLITQSTPPILKDSPIYQTLIQQYGSHLERYPSIEGRVQLLKAMGIETV